jgi:hypothetical protein
MACWYGYKRIYSDIKTYFRFEIVAILDAFSDLMNGLTVHWKRTKFKYFFGCQNRLKLV